MINLKQTAMAISALSLIGVASASFASSTCDTTQISSATAQCLSADADSTFQSNYETYLTQLKSGNNNNQQAIQRSNSGVNNSYYVAPQKKPLSTNSNTNTTNKTSSIRWF